MNLYTDLKCLDNTLRLLEHISKYGPLDPSQGLCVQPLKPSAGWLACYSSNITTTDILDVNTALETFVRDWAFHRGRPLDYPIEGSNDLYKNNFDKWNKETEYGKMRWQMLEDVKADVQRRLGTFDQDAWWEQKNVWN